MSLGDDPLRENQLEYVWEDTQPPFAELSVKANCQCPAYVDAVGFFLCDHLKTAILDFNTEWSK